MRELSIEDKELLLKDLCTMLPYGVKVVIEYSKGKYTHIYDLREIDNDATSELRQQVTVWNYGFYSSVISYPLIDCRPYLRPMSSMTEEEKMEYVSFIGGQKPFDSDFSAYPKEHGFVYEWDVANYVNWLNSHHFDYHGLIDKGLALEAPEGMYNIN